MGANSRQAEKLKSAGLFENCVSVLSEMYGCSELDGLNSSLISGRQLTGDRATIESYGLVNILCQIITNSFTQANVVKNGGLWLQAIGQDSELRDCLESDDVSSLLELAVRTLASNQNTLDENKATITLIAGLLASEDANIAQKLLHQNQTILPVCLLVLESDTTDGEPGLGALSVLKGLGACPDLRNQWDKVLTYIDSLLIVNIHYVAYRR